jgi:hypothetical protein
MIGFYHPLAKPLRPQPTRHHQCHRARRRTDAELREVFSSIPSAVHQFGRIAPRPFEAPRGPIRHGHVSLPVPLGDQR